MSFFLHGSRVTLAPIRALTSHLRRRFRSEYEGKYRFARLVSAFDLGLLIIGSVLLVFDFFIFFAPFRPSGLGISLRSAPIAAGEIAPMELTVEALDDRKHENVRLSLHLPTWAEMIKTEPPVGPHGSWNLGEIVPAGKKSVRFFVRARAMPGTILPIVVRLREGAGRFEMSFTGQEERKIERSALAARLAIPAKGIVAGGSVPIRIENSSSLTAPAVVLRFIQGEGEIKIGKMEPGERRMEFVETGSQTQGQVELEWELQDLGHAMDFQNQKFKVEAPVGIQIDPLSFADGDLTYVDYKSDSPARLWVHHPFQIPFEGYRDRLFEIAEGRGRLPVPLGSGIADTENLWSVIPVYGPKDHLVIGPRFSGLVTRSFPFKATIRYFADTGDQLGIGPLPPRVSEETSYWVAWSVGPFDSDLTEVRMRVRLRKGVRATGRSSSLISGIFTAQDGAVEWNVPRLSASGEPAVFAFEIAYLPAADELGEVPVLIDISEVSGKEVMTLQHISAQAPEQDANLEGDVKGKGKGRVE